jgi:hypothetical protein
MKWATPAISSGSWFDPNLIETDNWEVFAVSLGKRSVVKPLESVFLRQNKAVVISTIKEASLKKIGKQAY